MLLIVAEPLLSVPVLLIVTSTMSLKAAPKGAGVVLLKSTEVIGVFVVSEVKVILKSRLAGVDVPFKIVPLPVIVWVKGKLGAASTATAATVQTVNVTRIHLIRVGNLFQSVFNLIIPFISFYFPALHHKN